MAKKHVAIMMATYHGERFLPEQLESIAAQTHDNWSLWASDDSSTDGTQRALERFKQASDCDLHVLSGPRQGFVRNFFSLLHCDAIKADFFAFSDQDDIWHPNKLERALDWLNHQPADRPALYCTRTHLIDEAGQSLGLSPLCTRKPSFSNALVQNIGGGNTMVFNRAARDLLCCALMDIDVVCHDWWAYILIAGAGGSIHYDPIPSLDYRQHGGNLVGTNQGWGAQLKRVRMLAHGRFREWNERHVVVLDHLMHLLTPENRQAFQQFRLARNSLLPQRLWRFYNARLYRQTWLGNAGLLAAAILKRI